MRWTLPRGFACVTHTPLPPPLTAYADAAAVYTPTFWRFLPPYLAADMRHYTYAHGADGSAVRIPDDILTRHYYAPPPPTRVGAITPTFTFAVTFIYARGSAAALPPTTRGVLPRLRSATPFIFGYLYLLFVCVPLH